MRFMGRSGIGRGGSALVRAAFAAARMPTKWQHDAVWARYLANKAETKEDSPKEDSAETAQPSTPEE